MPHRRVELCNVNGRAALRRDGQTLDIEQRSNARFSSDPMAALGRWDELCDWAQSVSVEPGDAVFDPANLGPCVPRPGQVFAIGLNYRDHAKEAALQEPKQPIVFTKFSSCLAGASAEIPLTSDKVDWEIELVAVIGKRAHRVSVEQALSHVAGYCIGQDISDRALQFIDVPPQFSLGKSATNFGPLGPCLVDAKHIDPQDLELHCDINGQPMQRGHSRDMVFSVAEIIVYLSRYCVLSPGDIIFTGTPSGVGSGQKPRRYLQPDDLIHSEIPGIGTMQNGCSALT